MLRLGRWLRGRVKADRDVLARVALLGLRGGAHRALVGRHEAAEERPRPQAPGEDDVDLPGDEAELRRQPEPRQQPDDRREHSVGRARLRDDVLDVEAAERLQAEPADRREDRSGQHLAGRNVRRRQHAERRDEDEEVDGRRPREAGDPGDRRLDGAVAGEGDDDRRDDLRRADDHEDGQPAQPRAHVVGPVDAPDGPERVQRPAGGQGHAQPGPHRADDADGERDAAALQRRHVLAELLADHGNLRDGGVQHVLLEVRIALEQEAQDRGERQQQREDREEGPVGDERRQARRAVVGELLRDRAWHGRQRTCLLKAIDGIPHGLLAHRGRLTRRPAGIARVYVRPSGR